MGWDEVESSRRRKNKTIRYQICKGIASVRLPETLDIYVS